MKYENITTWHIRDLIADALDAFGVEGEEVAQVSTFGGPILVGLTITTEEGSEFQVTITRSKGADA